MGVSSDVIVQDPADAKKLFAHACAAVGLSPDAHHHVHDFGAVHMLQAAPDQDAEALVAVHYAADGGL
ncbi:hypothetical protein DL991_40850 [Amycolatopsis sp. WAC 01375]|uniref:hypothetical protein n=1 Tax=Amycolatopsis sp. WAC 01375 TaxID=2203194 RepID=UPI000F776D6D|nr:hypothetical protein [Amycolatopsis sp. WAC 01375]RSM68931.1 hypothetical protein DL991_40850 [Amycolatopsis sp. WAC 01375]